MFAKNLVVREARARGSKERGRRSNSRTPPNRACRPRKWLKRKQRGIPKITGKSLKKLRGNRGGSQKSPENLRRQQTPPKNLRKISGKSPRKQRGIPKISTKSPPRKQNRPDHLHRQQMPRPRQSKISEKSPRKQRGIPKISGKSPPATKIS